MESETLSTVRLKAVEEVAPRRPSPPSNPTPSPALDQFSTLDPVLTAFKALGFALSARALLFFALLGAFVLAVMAMWQQTFMSLYILSAYTLPTVVTTAVLEVRRRS